MKLCHAWQQCAHQCSLHCGAQTILPLVVLIVVASVQSCVTRSPIKMSLGKLYYSPASCGAASYIAASYTGLKFDSETVDLKSHKTASGQDFYQVNSKGNVPALVTPKGVLSEGPSVLQYIADQAPDLKLAPAFGSFERYQLIDTFNYIGSEVHKAYSPLFSLSWDDATKQKLRGAALDWPEQLPQSRAADDCNHLFVRCPHLESICRHQP